MRRSTYVLIGVFIAATVIAGSLGRLALERQLSIANTRDMVSIRPMAGFQKFAADIHWMLFIQYGGANDVDAETAPEFYRRIMRIISNDPDFYRAYYTGVLMLGPVAPNLALDIADRGLNNPRVRLHWELPMLAGQIVMNREKMKYYNNQPMDQQQLRLANGYFEQAKNCPGAGGIALRSYVRSLAALRPGDERLELKEIAAWYDYWQRQRRPLGYYGDGESNRMDMDVEELLLTQMRVAKARFPNDPEVEKLVERIVSEAFPARRLDPVTLQEYDAGDLYSPHSGVRVNVYGICGACSAVLKGRYCHRCGADSQPPAIPSGTIKPPPPPKADSRKGRP